MSGPIGWYGPATAMRRGFCTRCGTTLFSARICTNRVGLTMGSLYEPDRFRPTDHIWVSSKQAWLTLTDDLPCYEESAPT
jgi:hypothetical protein